MPANDKAHRYILSKAICPYYKLTTRCSLYCLGFLDNTSLIMTFGNIAEKKRYQRDYCCKQWQGCPRAAMLAGMGESIGNKDHSERLETV